MCNICRRIEAVQSIDSILLKPLKVILTKLHERIEPELGDSFLRREARIHSIKKNLQCLEIGPLKPIIKLIISDLDSELHKLEVSKLDHPAYRTVGKYNHLKTKIGPDDSSSIRAWVENQANEVEETKLLKKMVALQSSSRTQGKPKIQKDLITGPKHLMGPGSSTESEYLSETDDMTEIDYIEHDDRLPVEGALEWSTHVVDEWFKKNGESNLLSEGLRRRKMHLESIGSIGSIGNIGSIGSIGII
ncbi:hypothetical protein H4I95_00165 [Botrytis cinerea]